MKVQARYIIKNESILIPEFGRKFWIIGDYTNPVVGSIYDTEENASDYTESEIAYMKEKFSHLISFVD